MKHTVEKMNSLVKNLHPSHLPSLGQHLELSSALSHKAANNNPSSMIACPAKSLNRLNERIIMDQTPDPEAALNVLRQRVCLAQEIIADSLNVADWELFKNMNLELALKPRALPAANLPLPAPQHDLNDNELRQSFARELEGCLDFIADNIAILDNEPFNKQALSSIIHSFNTIKDTSSFISLHNISQLAHELASAMELVCDKKLDFNQKLKEALREGIEQLRGSKQSMDEAGPSAADSAFTDKRL